MIYTGSRQTSMMSSSIARVLRRMKRRSPRSPNVQVDGGLLKRAFQRLLAAPRLLHNLRLFHLNRLHLVVFRAAAGPR